MAATQNSVKRSFYGKLSGDTTLNNLLASPAAGFSKSIYYEVAPKTAPFPFVIFNKQSGIARYAMTTTPALENDLWLFKGVDRGTSADPAEAIQARLEALLNDGALSISGGTQMYLRFESKDGYAEVDGDTVYHHAVLIYRLLHQ